MAEGFTALGHAVTWHGVNGFTADDVIDTDVAVTFGQRLWSGEIAKAYRSIGVPVLTIDLPPIRREGYRALWLNHVNWIPESSCPPYRLQMLGVRLGVRERGRGFLVCGQKGGDAAHEMSKGQIRQWAETACRHAKGAVWRPHPQEVFDLRGVPMSDPRNHSLDEILRRNWRALVTFNSTCGWEALIRGIPVVCSPTAPYAQACSTSLADLENPKRPSVRERIALLSRAAFTQWTWDELASGEAQNFVLNQLQFRQAA